MRLGRGERETREEKVVGVQASLLVNVDGLLLTSGGV